MDSPTTLKTSFSRAKGSQQKPSIRGLADGMFKRLAKRAGVGHINHLVYSELRSVVESFLKAAVKDALNVAEYARRKRMSQEDVVYALERRFNKKTYKMGAEDDLHTCKIYEPKTKKAQKDKHARMVEEIKHYQAQHDCVFFARSAFKSVVNGIIREYSDDMGAASKAVGTLQIAVEDYLTTVLQSAVLCASHDGRQTLYPKDIQLAIKLRGPC